MLKANVPAAVFPRSELSSKTRKKRGCCSPFTIIDAGRFERIQPALSPFIRPHGAKQLAKREMTLIELLGLLILIVPAVFAAAEISEEGGGTVRCVFGVVFGLALGVAIHYLTQRLMSLIGRILDPKFNRPPSAGFLIFLGILAVNCCFLWVGALSGRSLGSALVKLFR
jgi:hypothetical protein